MLTARIANRAEKLRRAVCETAGIARYSRPGREDLDRKLEPYLPSEGFFVEAGALDGYHCSNTYYLERIKGWRGVLVEPNYWEYQFCLRERPQSQVFNFALVAHDYPQPTIRLTYGSDLSFVEGAYMGSALDSRHDMLRYVGRKVETFEVPARTLTSVLEEAGAPAIDFFSLDVEGYELAVLKGLDFQRNRPRVLLVECQTEAALAEMTAFLGPDFALEAKLTRLDYLFLLRKEADRKIAW